jgi:hypothetical protein
MLQLVDRLSKIVRLSDNDNYFFANRCFRSPSSAAACPPAALDA